MLYSELNNFMWRASVDVTSCRVFPLVHVPLNLLCVFEALMPRLNAPMLVVGGLVAGIGFEP